MIALLSLLIWLYLFLAHGWFWRSAPELTASAPAQLPDVDIVVPARDEAQTIGAVIASLLAQDYRGRLRVILVDDNSTDETAELAGTAAAGRTESPDPAGADPAPRLEIISLTSKPAGWSGKLWALSRGIAAGHAPILLLTDADIVHDPRHLSSLVAKLLESRADMVSEMVRLNCTSLAERALVPAFV